MYGTTDTQSYKRQSTKQTDWAKAEAHVRSLQATSADTKETGPLLSDCIALYLGDRPDLAPRTMKQYVALLGAPVKGVAATTGLLPFAHSKNKYFIRQLDATFLKDFRVNGMGDIKASTKKMRLAKLKHFLREAYRVDWTLIPLVEKMAKSSGGSAKGSQPFNVTKASDTWNEDEVNRILEVAGSLVSRSGYGSRPGTFRLHCELMNETGMRVSDTISFDPRLCVRSGEMWAYNYNPKKQKHDREEVLTAVVYLTDRLKTAIESCVWMSTSLPFAYCGRIYRYPAKPAKGEPDLTEKLALEVYKHLQVIGPKAGVVGSCRPHRFRDTFACRLIVAGMDLLDIKEALNHQDSRVTEKYYLTWFEARTKMLVTKLHGILSKLHEPAIVAKAA